jgi:hypothetical protein
MFESQAHHQNDLGFVSLGTASRWVLYGLELRMRPASAPTLPGFQEKDRMPKHPAKFREETLFRASGRVPKLVCARNMRE